MNQFDFDRFTNPLSTKLGLDTLPDFVPPEHYKQVIYFCNEALELINAKKDCCFTLSEIKLVIEEYEELFEETEIWLKIFSNFEPFSLTYLKFCELKVFIDDYGKDCKKALTEYNHIKLADWFEKYHIIFFNIQQTIDFDSIEFVEKKKYVPLKNTKYLIPREDVLAHFDFTCCFNKAKLTI
jgi:hypothetical protein